MAKNKKNITTSTFESAMDKTFSRTRIKLLTEKTGLSKHILGKIIFDERWQTYNLYGPFIEWCKTGDIKEVSNWVLETYCTLNCDRIKYPHINKEFINEG